MNFIIININLIRRRNYLGRSPYGLNFCVEDILWWWSLDDTIIKSKCYGLLCLDNNGEDKD